VSYLLDTNVVSELARPKPEAAVTRWLKEIPAEELFLIVYEDLRRLAYLQMARQAAGHTLQPTALVNEAYLKLAGQGEAWQSPAHFMRVAARAMRQILVDHGRAAAADKRLPAERRVDMESLVESYAVDYDQRAGDLVALDRALVRLEQRDPRAHQGLHPATADGKRIPAGAPTWTRAPAFPGSAIISRNTAAIDSGSRLLEMNAALLSDSSSCAAASRGPW
jgi:RNA polymerase sigma factor (TIGR02999 family)